MVDEQNIKKDLLEELDLKELPEEKQDEILQVMTESLLKRLTLRIMENLSDDDKEEYEEIRKQEDGDKMEEFLREKIDGYDELVENTVADFKKEIKGHMEEIKKEMENTEEEQ